MRILSWNVNGLRKLGRLDVLFQSLHADIICIQETRVSGEWDPHLESLAFVKGYDSFFSICKQKRGYSGVATFCKQGHATPIDAAEGLRSKVGGAKLTPNPAGFYGICTLPECPCENAGCSEQSLILIEEEGRCVITDHQHFVLINIYAPAVSVEGRGKFKMEFLHALEGKITALRRNGRHVLVVGDFNICPSVRDMAEPIPASQMPFWERRPSRQWLLHMLASDGLGFVDTFRGKNPAARDAYSCWSEMTRARENNHGVRIDLVIADRDFFSAFVKDAAVHADVHGSDHCPVSVTIECPTDGLRTLTGPPKFCTVYLPRFALRQKNLKDMFPVFTKGTSRPKIELSDRGVSRGFIKKETVGVDKRPKSGLIKSRIQTSKVQKRKRQQTQASISSFFSSHASCPPQPAVKHNSIQDIPTQPSSNVTDSTTEADAKLFSAVDHSGTNPEQYSAEKNRKRQETAKAWRKILTGPPPPPFCKHGIRCALKVVGKSGENKGRTFFSCPYPGGIGKAANCNFFQWAPYKGGMATLPK